MCLLHSRRLWSSGSCTVFFLLYSLHCCLYFSSYFTDHVCYIFLPIHCSFLSFSHFILLTFLSFFLSFLLSLFLTYWLSFSLSHFFLYLILYRHFEKLFSLIKVIYYPGIQFSLDFLLCNGILGHKDSVAELSSTASGEARLEDSLEKIKSVRSILERGSGGWPMKRQ